MAKRSTILGTLAGIALAAALPWIAGSLRGPGSPRCASDGVALEGAPVVQVVEGSGATRSFCCVGCAEEWIRAASASPASVRVTDASTGRLVDARDARFVRSAVVAQPATRDRVHAFASAADAERHAAAYRGALLSGEDRPFATAR